MMIPPHFFPFSLFLASDASLNEKLFSIIIFQQKKKKKSWAQPMLCNETDVSSKFGAEIGPSECNKEEEEKI